MRVSESLVINAIGIPPAGTDAEALILPLLQDSSLSGTAEAVNAALNGLVAEMRDRKEFRAESCETAILPTLGRLSPARVALVGLGKAKDLTPVRASRAVAAACRALGKRSLYHAVIDIADLPLDSAEASAAVAEGAELSRYEPDPYRTTERRDTLLRRLDVAGADEAALREGHIRGIGKNLARDLTNQPSNILGPVELAERAVEMAAEVGLGCRVLDHAEMEALSMHAILTVARGSETPGRFIVLEHRKGGDGPLLALIGKGVMFDTGGISIKPSAEMGRMKGDMAGGAAVFGAMRAIAELDIPANVIGLIPAVVNMPDGRAWRPGDVVRTKGGKTVETITTDAEGRMLLCDAVAYARELGAAYLVDIATLTGACGIALGQVASGLFGTDEGLIQQVREAGEAAGERHWPMPLFREYRELIRSEIADLKNSGGRLAGAVTAAWFIREFAGDVPWAHLDIAGSAQSDKPRPWAPSGPTGTGVGTFINLAQRLAREGRLGS